MLDCFCTPCIHIYIYIHCFNFYHSLDNDRSTVETSSFSVDFYRKNFQEILAYKVFISVSKNAHRVNRKISVEIILFKVHLKNSWDKNVLFAQTQRKKIDIFI